MNNHIFTRKVPSQAKWLCLLTVIPLYFIGSSLIGTALLKFVIITFSLHLDEMAINAYLNLIVDLGMLLYVAWIFKDSLKQQWYDFKKDIKKNLFYGCVIGVLFIYGAGFLGNIISALLGATADSQNQALISTMTGAYPVVMFISTVILAPILEEIIFRGIIFGWVYEINPKLAHFISAFIFGFVHVMIAMMSGNISEFIQIFSYFFMGFALSYLYEKRNNIYVPILTHTMNNLISIMLIIFVI